MPAAWAITEVGVATLGDRRRTRRLAQVRSDRSGRPGDGIPAACASPAATKAAYRFFAAPTSAPEAILAAHVAATAERLHGQGTLLARQDTTALDFTADPALAGAGPLAPPAQRGVLLHSVLAATLEGVPLGLLHQHHWTRDPAVTGLRHIRRQRPPCQQESQRWLDAQTATQQVVPPEIAVITVADREADIDDLFALERPPHAALLIRATHNRRIAEETR